MLQADDDRTLFPTTKAVEDHWQQDCQAFMLTCPFCNRTTKSTGHSCIKELKKDKQSLQKCISVFNDEVKKCQDGIAKRSGNFEFEGNNPIEKLSIKFEKDIFKWLDEEDRQDVIKELEESLDEGDQF